VGVSGGVCGVVDWGWHYRGVSTMAVVDQESVKTVNVKYSDALKNINVHVRVTGVKRARVRLWIAMRIIAIGVWVSGMGLKIEE